MCVRVCACMRACVCVYMCACACACVRMYVRVYVHVCMHVYVSVCLCVRTLCYSKCVSVKSSSCCMQIISSSEEYMDLLLSLGEFALLHNNVQMREATRSLLKLIPSG